MKPKEIHLKNKLQEREATINCYRHVMCAKLEPQSVSVTLSQSVPHKVPVHSRIRQLQQAFQSESVPRGVGQRVR